jgi:ketosteroid isomerase-like protein
MSQENVELVRQVVDATNRGDADAFVAALSPDVEWEDNLFGTEGGRTYRGAAEVRD